MGILAVIGIPLITGVLPSASRETAERNLNWLNGAVVQFNQANWELVLAPASDASDEQAIYNSLRFRDPLAPTPGSPFLPSHAVFNTSSASNAYRAVWNGRMFQLVGPGSAGTGIDLLNLSGTPGPDFLTNTPVQPR